jgi:glycosyltransferase involved in cell wall biosynthesis
VTDRPVAPPELCLVATSSPAATGGLAAYTRFLARHLTGEFSVASVARFAQGGPREIDYAAREPPRIVRLDDLPVHIIAPSDAAVPLLRIAQRFADRPLLQGLAPPLFRIGYSRPLARVVTPHVRVIHSIGVGWEMLGFSALALARSRGAAFTVCPAIAPTWGAGRLDAKLYQSADAVFALSRHERQSLLDLGVNAARVVVTGLAPATDSVGNGERFRDRHGVGGRPMVLFVGRKQKYKGYHALREAMAALLDRVPNAVLVAIGSDWEPPYPALPPGMLLDLGPCDEPEKADAFAACDVFCMPSAAEAFGIAYVEAWSYGKPVVGGMAPAVRELIREGRDGFCVPQEPGRIAELLVRLLADSELRDRLGSAGLARQQREFTWKAVADVHKQTFTALLAGRPLQ